MAELFLRDLDLPRYHRWWKRASPSAPSLVICDEHGMPVWSADDTVSAQLAAALPEHHGGTLRWRFDGGGLGVDTLADGQGLAYRPVDASGRFIRWLTIPWSQDDHPSDLDALAEALDDLSTAMADELQLKTDLNGMTAELAERYDELHLVYGVDEQVRRHGSQEVVIQSLLTSCANHLDVDVVAFVRPNKNQCISAMALSQPIHNLDLVLVEMRGDLYRFVQATRETLVMNDMADARRAYIFTDMPYKILACPVRCESHVDAMLVLLNHRQKPDFSNSDRRLADVLASQLTRLVQAMSMVQQLSDFTRQMAAALVEAVEAKDPYTRGHSERVHHLSMEIGRAMDIRDKDLENLYWGSLLHDVGKIGIPDAVLCKPARLTADEYAFIMVHPERSYEILRHIDYLADAVPGARHHQEKWDGTGYPHGLKGERIPLHARIIAVADTYDSITSSRAYRAGRPHEDAMREIDRVTGTQLDPTVVAVFRQLCETDPPPEWMSRFSIRRAPTTPAPTTTNG
ncbi:HD-GYP domain-containing protein [Ideonella sp.]|jgi:HD-GYP domain-containing protein (c-di-GMP phosphodiesterase class II)|uniref:HD-GYP domain-containing protein n=1 Tax=Ideonella sp. TaxID=1929293 RepID=UPI0037BE3672